MDAPRVFVDGHAQNHDLEAAIAAACRQLLPGFCKETAVQVGHLAGGISNSLFVVTSGQNKVAFRIYGDNTERFIDRAMELDLMRLVHRHGFGPQVLAVFANGRVEEFLPMRSLEPQEMASPAFAPTIAATLRRFHDIQAAQGPNKEARTPFGRIYEWLDIAEQFRFDDAQKQQVFETFNFASLRAEVREVEEAAAAAKSPIVFSHNDLLSGNVMVPLHTAADGLEAGPAGPKTSSSAGSTGGCQADQQQRQSMTFIDFEYADQAPRGFDWGNHFNEYAGFECDYTRYPAKEQAELFIRHYLEAGGDSEVDSTYLSRCVAEANIYALASHQYWGTWSLLQAKWSSIDFDYLAYAQQRWGEHRNRRDEFLAQAAAAFGSA